MPATYPTALDEIKGIFRARWAADSPALNGGVAPEVFWDGVPRKVEPDPTKPWAEVVVRHVTGVQSTLSQDTGKRRFEKGGVVTVAVYAPLGAVGGLGTGELLVEVAKKAFEGKATANGVWFRNARIVEVGHDRAWYHWNVIADFVYDEFV